METPALPFDDVEQPPTTRAVALLVKRGGPAALPNALRKADEARYQEITCRSALNRTAGMPFDWTLNPYRGCTHGCHYCYARRYHAHLELGPGDEFSSLIFVKTNLVDVLRRELARPSWTRELVAVGTATDAYQPIEGQHRLTRRALEALLEHRTPVSIATKGPLVVRDRDVLSDLTQAAGCSVYFSVPSVDEEAWQALEPDAPPPMQRLRAMHELAEAGIRTGVLIAPVVPGFTDRRDRLERTVKAARDHGAKVVAAMPLRLQEGTRTYFFTFLSREFPHLLEEYERLYTGTHAPWKYVSELERAIGMLEVKFGFRPSGACPGGAERGRGAERAGCATEPRLRS